MHIYWSERMLGSGGSFASSQPGTLVEQPTQFSNHQPASSISLLEQEKNTNSPFTRPDPRPVESTASEGPERTASGLLGCGLGGTYM